MPVTISPPLFIELGRSSWDAPYETDVAGGPYTIAYESSDAISDTLKIEFSQTDGPLRFCELDGTTTIDAPVSIPDRGTFQFMTRVSHDILNDQSSDITFRGLITTTEESTTGTVQPDPWYELVTDPQSVVFDASDTEEVNVYFRQVRTTAGVETRTNAWPADGFSITAADERSEQLVTLSSQDREDKPTRLRLVFDAEQGLYQPPAKFILKLTNNNIYKDQGGHPLEVTLKLSKKRPVTRGGGGDGGTDPDPEEGNKYL